MSRLIRPPRRESPPTISVEDLCEKCRQLPWDTVRVHPSPGEYALIDHHKTLGELRNSAKAGCRTCQIFWLYIIAETKAKGDDDFELKFAYQGGFDRVQIIIEDSSQSFTRGKRERIPEYISMGRSQFALGNQARRDSGEIQFSGGQESMSSPNHTVGETSTTNKKFVAGIEVYSDKIVRRAIYSSRYDNLDLENIMQNIVNPWVDDCVKTHDGCREVQQLGFESCTPTRLIDVGTTHENTVKLVDSGGLSKPRYLIFSYCWGASNDRSKTTRANIEQRRESILIAALPESIRDAIAVTKLMGVRYLWVDAICIIQEDKENNDGFLDDWNIEAAKMASYYSNALCCISNLSAADSSEGFLRVEKAGLRQEDRQRTFTQRIGVEHFDYVRYSFDNTTATMSIHMPRRVESWPEQWEGSPLMRRAWALQEWILSRRILHCTKVGMFMECGRGVCQPNDPFPKPVAAWHQTRDNELSSILKESSKAQIGGLWMKLVTFYSKMNLTDPTDRLVAIDGIARLICAKYNIGYFAGVLSSHVAQMLLWKRVDPKGEVDSDNIFQLMIEKVQLFPSWSWSSKPNVEFPKFEKCTSSVRCIDSSCFVLSDKVGNYADPSSRLFPLRGPILPFTVTYYPEFLFGGTNFFLDRNSPLWRGNPITIYMDSTKERTKLENIATDREKKLLPQWRLLVCMTNVIEGPLVSDIYKDLYWGLIVENLKDIGTNAYRRIGYFEVTAYAWGPERPDLNLEEWMTDINLY
ncbi:uncharacterized protein TrAtP1_001556 [Trichoderma atroviride]|uniref:uncharacterized protein n=1 Tax=Hypocrea atroviridis TaxID=63577 RepID=UPI00332D20BB|nr:hypothetical protein TrAtP1_001556 [Trichoderma atroviride]